ncbi:MAG: SDR family oxidoreductase [Desulfobacteraceae bacterium]
MPENAVRSSTKNLDSMHPIGHLGRPEDIAYGALYLASDESAFVTGSELVIDGGYPAQQQHNGPFDISRFFGRPAAQAVHARLSEWSQ